MFASCLLGCGWSPNLGLSECVESCLVYTAATQASVGKEGAGLGATSYGLGLNTHEHGLAKFFVTLSREKVKFLPACPMVVDHVMIKETCFPASACFLLVLNPCRKTLFVQKRRRQSLVYTFVLSQKSNFQLSITKPNNECHPTVQTGQI